MSDPKSAQANSDAGPGQAAATEPKADASVLGAAAPASDPKAGAAQTDPAPQDGTKPKDGEADPKAPVVPEKYEFKLPDGMTIDADAYAEVEPMFKELKLTNEQAQKVADAHIKAVQKLQAQQRDAWVKQNEGWVKSMKSDAEYGGDKFDTNLGGIKKAIDKVAGEHSAAFSEMLDITGAGNHPEMARFLYRVGKMVGEGSMVRGEGSVSSPKPTEQVLYTSMQKQGA